MIICCRFADGSSAGHELLSSRLHCRQLYLLCQKVKERLRSQSSGRRSQARRLTPAYGLSGLTGLYLDRVEVRPFFPPKGSVLRKFKSF